MGWGEREVGNYRDWGGGVKGRGLVEFGGGRKRGFIVSFRVFG